MYHFWEHVSTFPKLIFDPVIEVFSFSHLTLIWAKQISLEYSAKELFTLNRDAENFASEYQYRLVNIMVL